MNVALRWYGSLTENGFKRDDVAFLQRAHHAVQEHPDMRGSKVQGFTVEHEKAGRGRRFDAVVNNKK